MTSLEDPAGRPKVRAGEPPLRVFISGVMDAETMDARADIVSTLDKFPFLASWAFEFTPPSSEQLDWSYLQKVRDCELLIWIVGSTTSEPVQREIHEALAHNKPIIVIRIEGANPDAATDELARATGTKWHSSSLADIPGVVALSVSDDIVRAYRQQPARHRSADLDAKGRLSLARCVERWLAAGLTRREALGFAGDPEIGQPPTNVVPTADEPLKIILGEVGAGKSLVGDRLFQEALTRAVSDRDAPIPVWLHAQEVSTSGLTELVEKSVGSSVNLERNGAFVIVDDVSQGGTGRAEEILREARVFVEAFPSTRVVITCRPLPALNRANETVPLEPLTGTRALDIISTLTGQAVTGHGWPASVRDAVRRPLFAVLAAVYLREHQHHVPRSPGDLTRHLVSRAISPDRPEVEALLRRLGRLSTDREGAAVPVQEIGGRAELQRAYDTGLVVEHDEAVSFGLPILTEWFAGQSLLEGNVPISDLADDAPRLDLWRYALVVALGEASFDGSCSLIEPIVRNDPGFASEVIVEAMPRWEADTTDAQLPGNREVGQWIHGTTTAWVETFDSLAPLMAITRSDGSLLPLAVAVSGDRVTEVYRIADDITEPVSELSPTYNLLGDNPGWGYFRSAPPPIEPAWPWRWSHETIAGFLKEVTEGQHLVPPDGPLFDELVWASSLVLVNSGSLRSDPIDLADIDQVLSVLPEDAALDIDRRTVPLETIRRRIKELRTGGATHLDPPWPGWDRPPRTGWVWGPFSPERLLERTTAVFEGAMRGYIQVVETWLSPLSKRLMTYTTLPAQLTGTLTVGDGDDLASAPVLSWWFDALEPHDQSSVRIDLRTPPAPSIFEGPAGRAGYAQLIARRPQAQRWLIAKSHQQALDIFGATPATELAFAWLADDLKRIQLSS